MCNIKGSNLQHQNPLTHFLKIVFICFFRQGGREREREQNTNVWLPLAHPPLGTWPATQACALTGNQFSDPLACRPALSPLSHTSQGPFIHFLIERSHINCYSG